LLIAGAFGIFWSIPQLGRGARWACALLLSLTGVGALMDGIFTLESFMLHFAGFGLVLATIVTLPIVGLVLRRLPDWKRIGSWLIVSGPVTLALAILYFATFNPEAAGAGQGIGGLTQRILILEILAWYVVLGALAFRRAHE
jgi:hypothetical protein